MFFDRLAVVSGPFCFLTSETGMHKGEKFKPHYFMLLSRAHHKMSHLISGAEAEKLFLQRYFYFFCISGCKHK